MEFGDLPNFVPACQMEALFGRWICNGQGGSTRL